MENFDSLTILLYITGIEHTSDFNSWEQARKTRAKIKEEHDPTLTSLEDAWRRQLGVLGNQEVEAKIFDAIEEFERSGQTPFEVFMHFVKSGTYPPPEIMLAVSDSLFLYILGKGEVELEDVFFGPRVKKRGNHASRFDKDLVYIGFEAGFFCGAEHSRLSLEKKAEVYLAQRQSISQDVDAFLRGYRRWKNNNKKKNLSDN